MRISGISSGFDTETMIKELISVEQNRVNKYLRQQTTYQWKQEAYNNINKSMANFIINSRKEFGLTQITAFGTVRASSLNSLNWIKKASSSDEKILTAKTRADAINGTHSVEVKSLAKSAVLTSQNLKGTLVDENGKFLTDGEIEIQTNVDGVESSVVIKVTAGSSMSEFVNKINNAKVGDKSAGLRASYDNGVGKLIITTRATGGDQLIKIKQNSPNNFVGQDITHTTIKFDSSLIQTVDGQDTFAASKKLKIQIGDKTTIMEVSEGTLVDNVISVLKGMGVEASFDKDSKEILITGPYQQAVSITDADDGTELIETVSIVDDTDGLFVKGTTQFRSDETIKVKIGDKEVTVDVAAEDDIRDLIKKLEALAEVKSASYVDGALVIEPQNEGDYIRITDSKGRALAGGAFSVLGTEAKGENAKITFNGDEIEKNTNDFTLYGIEFNLKSAQVGTTVSINVTTDVDSIYEKISNFVSSYNKLVDEINGKLNEKTYRKYYPLVEEERSAMNENDIKLWEEKAKSGLLRNDTALSKALQNIRTSLYDKVEGGSYDHISQIGITTGNYKDGGKLVIDEEKLKDAIMNDPEGVMNLFFKVPDTTELGEQRTKESGLLQRVYDGFITAMKDVVRQSGTGDDANLLREVQSNILIDFVTDQGSISLIDRDILSLTQRISREQQLLISKEERYWKQFTAMEKALAQLNQQSSWLMSQLGLGQ